jgi:hypothetical protein
MMHEVSKILFCHETLHVSWQNKILDTWYILLVIYTKIITIHGHLNVKNMMCLVRNADRVSIKSSYIAVIPICID